MATRNARRSSAVQLRQTTLLSSMVDRPIAVPNLLEQLSGPTRHVVMALCRKREHAAGEVLFRQGDAHHGLFLIDRGLVRSFYVSEDGRELTLGFWTAGHFVGAPQMFAGGKHAWTSVAEAPTQSRWLPGLQLRELAGKMPDLALALMDALVYKSECYCALLQLLATHSMRARLARLLSMLAAREDGVDISLSHGQLASMIGSTRQWVSLTLARFEIEGFIAKQSDGALQVLRPKELATVK